LGVIVEENWEKVLNYFDIPTLVIGVTLVVIAGIWYIRRRKQKKLTDLTPASVPGDEQD
jgi:LPXTG-motif cell wall-anchored protein